MNRAVAIVLGLVLLGAGTGFPATVVTPMVENLDGGGYNVSNVGNITAAGTVVAGDVVTKGPWVDVRAYGAVGDGSTDDTTAIQAAVNTGKGVFVPAGNYRITSVISLLGNQRIWGTGPNSRIFTPNTQYLFSINYVNNVSISNLLIEGNNTAGANKLSGGGIYVGVASNVIVRECIITKHSYIGILFGTTVTNSLIEQNIIQEGAAGASESSDICLYSSSHYNVVQRNQCLSTTTDLGIYNFYSNYNKILYNQSSGHARHGIACVYAGNGSDHLIIRGNYCANNGWTGIYLNNTSYCQVEANRCTGNATLTGDDLIGNILLCDSSYNTIANNECDNAAAKNGIEVRSGAHNLITGNYCHGNPVAGISLGADNRAIGNRSDSNVYGIQCRGGGGASYRTIIEANDCRSNTSDGIIVFRCQDVVVNGNICAGNSRAGVYLAGASGQEANNNVISGNRCMDNGDGTFYDGGISVSAYCYYNVVTGNICTGNNPDGILLWYNVDYHTVTGNNSHDNTYNLRYSGSNNVIGNNYAP